MNTVFLKWHQMTEREQAVWAVAFSSKEGPAISAAKQADAVVLQLRGLEIDSDGPAAPEYRAAERNIHLERSDFDAWYRVEYWLENGRRSDFRAPTEEECSAAYERYNTSRADFY